MKILLEAPIRGLDAYGSGEWHAKRSGGRLHNGIDRLSPPGFFMRTPVAGEVTKLGYCYNDDLSFRYVQITCRRDLKHRFMYLIPCVKEGDIVSVGDRLGRVDNLQRRYPMDGKHHSPITNHIHYEIIGENGEYINPDSL